jgi:hypothetical protein
MTTRRWRAAVAATLIGSGALAVSCGPRARSTEAFCAQLKVVRDLDEVLAGGSADKVAERAGQLQELQQSAPDEIAPHVSRLAGVTDDLARTMGSVPDPRAAVSDVFSRRQAELPEITASGRAVEAFAASHCEVQLNPAATAPPAGPAPTDPPSTVTRTTRPTTSTSTRRTSTTRRSSASPTTRAKSTSTRSATSRSRTTTTTTRRR